MSLGPLGTVIGTQLLASFQSPEGGFVDHVALAAGLVSGSRKTAQIVKSAATAGARSLQFREILFMIY